MAWDEPSVGWLLRPSMALPAGSGSAQLRPAFTRTPRRRVSAKVTHTVRERHPGRHCRVLRLASYFRTVLSAVLTSARQRGSSFTRVSGLSSAPLRSGSASPTVFFKRPSRREYYLFAAFFDKAAANPLTSSSFTGIIQPKSRQGVWVRLRRTF